MEVAVFVQQWQHECCGVEFEVGDEVAWKLAADQGFRQEQLGAGALLRPCELSAAGVLAADPPERGGLLLERGGVHAFLPQEGDDQVTGLPGGAITWSVGLFEEHHHGHVPPAVPATAGRVAELHLVRCTYALDTADGVHKVVAGSARFSPVRRASRMPVPQADDQGAVGFLVILSVAI